MIVTSITRKVTGNHYDNISFTAEIEEGEDPKKIAIDLNKLCEESLEAIKIDDGIRFHANKTKSENLEKLEVLKKAIEDGRVSDLPF